MIDALISGRIYGKTAERESANGNRYATAKVRVSLRDGEAMFVNVIAFADQPVRALLSLDEGESVALSGELTPKVWQDKERKARPSLDLLAHVVLTAYHVTRRREAMREEGSAP